MNYIAHHGIKGQKWGVRRFQNEDGSYKPGAEGRYYDSKSDKKQERINKRNSEKYKRLSIKAEKDFVKNRSKIYAESYNQTADEYNNGKIDEYNRTHSPKDKDYYDEYDRQFSDDWKKNYNKRAVDYWKNNKNYKKADAFAQKYGLYKVDELAIKNKSFIEDMIKSDYTLDVTSEESKKKYGPN